MTEKNGRRFRPRLRERLGRRPEPRPFRSGSRPGYRKESSHARQRGRYACQDCSSSVVPTGPIPRPSPRRIRIGRSIHEISRTLVWRDRLFCCRYPPKDARCNAGNSARCLKNIRRSIHDARILRAGDVYRCERRQASPWARTGITDLVSLSLNAPGYSRRSP